MLYDQPSKWPTRKLTAVIFAAIIVNGLIAGLEVIWPGVSESIPAREYVDALAAIIAGYMTREKM